MKPNQKQLESESKLQASLSIKIEQEYNKLATLLGQVPDQYLTLKKIEGTGGMVSVADIVAYQIGWGKLVITWYETGLKKAPVDMPGEGFSTWNYTGLAHHFYAKYQYDSHTKQMEEFEKIVQRIIEIAEHEHKTGNLDKVNVWNWCTLPSGKQWPLSKWITVNTSSPYKRASSLIRKFLKTIHS